MSNKGAFPLGDSSDDSREVEVRRVLDRCEDLLSGARLHYLVVVADTEEGAGADLVALDYRNSNVLSGMGLSVLYGRVASLERGGMC